MYVFTYNVLFARLTPKQQDRVRLLRSGARTLDRVAQESLRSVPPNDRAFQVCSRDADAYRAELENILLSVGTVSIPHKGRVS